MQIAEILSDLMSLRVCEHDAAMALVNSYKQPEQTPTPAPKDTPKELTTRPNAYRKVSGLEGTDNPDLQRALDLMDLHYGVKEKHTHGTDEGLRKAREEVDRVLQGINNKGGRGR